MLETLVEELSDLEMLAVEGEEHKVYNSEFILKVYSHIAEKQKYAFCAYSKENKKIEKLLMALWFWTFLRT